MKEHDFLQLVESVKEMKKIRKGSLKPAKITKFNPVSIKSIRHKLHQSQAEFAFMIGRFGDLKRGTGSMSRADYEIFKNELAKLVEKAKKVAKQTVLDAAEHEIRAFLADPRVRAFVLCGPQLKTATTYLTNRETSPDEVDLRLIQEKIKSLLPKLTLK